MAQMEVTEVKNCDFCIEQIARSGQCFRINKLDAENLWQVVAFGKLLKIQRMNESTHIFHCSPEEYKDIWVDYFDLGRDYGEIKKFILSMGDPYLAKAVEYGSGLRILRQDPWETIVSFLISQRNNITRIKRLIEKICLPYGNIFPGPSILASCSEEDFRTIGLGYRAKYLTDISEAVNDGKLDIEYLRQLDYEASIKYLKSFSGIGTKVANCIALYGLQKFEAFPVDTWVRRIIEKQYGGKFDIKRFSKYAGIVQQYMFFYQRESRRKSLHHS
jgi:N-glycosylase/DNA lyase